MAEAIADWAGKERLFRLNLGLVLDLEQACGGAGIGEIFLRVSGGKFGAADLYHIIRMGLIGGGESKVSAKQLMDRHFDSTSYYDNASVATDLLIALMSGVEDTAPHHGSAKPEPFKFSEVSQICRVFSLSPLELREMTYADFVNLMRGYNASAQQKAEPPTEEEFEDILARYEPEALK